MSPLAQHSTRGLLTTIAAGTASLSVTDLNNSNRHSCRFTKRSAIELDKNQRKLQFYEFPNLYRRITPMMSALRRHMILTFIMIIIAHSIVTSAVASIITYESSGSIALNIGPDPLVVAGSRFALSGSLDSNAIGIQDGCCVTDYKTFNTILTITSGIHAGNYQSTGDHFVILQRESDADSPIDRLIVVADFTIDGSSLVAATWHTYSIGTFGNPSISVFDLRPPSFLPGSGNTAFSNMFDFNSTTSYNLQGVALSVSRVTEPPILVMLLAGFCSIGICCYRNRIASQWPKKKKVNS